VYERLTRRQPDGSIAGWLATSFEQVDPLTWRFRLREDVKFTDGAPLNADAIVAAVTYQLDPDNASQCRGDYPSVIGAEKVDEYTVDIKTKIPDPILPGSFGTRFFVVSPKFLSETPKAEAAVTAVGTGP